MVQSLQLREQETFRDLNAESGLRGKVPIRMLSET